MRHLIALTFLALVAAAPIGDPSLPQFTSEERAIIQSALQKLRADVPGQEDRIDGILSQTHAGLPFGGRDFPLIGLALSRASKDPAACATLKRIEPSAVCMK